MALVLGVDSSTQSTKCEIRDVDDGTLIASARAAHPSTRPPRSEQSPQSWWDAFGSAVSQAKALHQFRSVAAISVAGQQHGMVLLGRDGAVLRDAKLWNDTESADEARMLAEAMPGQEWADAVGSVPLAAFTLSKLVWLSIHEPSVLDQVTSVLLPHDYLNYRLTGELATDRGDASGTGYFQPATGRWRPDLLERFVQPGPWEKRLPRVLGPLDPVGPVSSDILEALDLTGEAVVGPGTGDNMAAALGAGLKPSDVAMSLGTSGTVYTTYPRPVCDPSGTVAGFADATGGFLPLACTLNATRVTATVAGWLGISEIELSALAAKVTDRTEQPVLVPYFEGERTPNRPNATGMLSGLTTATNPAQIARAAFEGVVCGLLDGLDALAAQTGTVPNRIVLVGGGARSPAYRRAVADLSGVPVLVPAEEEHVAVGACVQAAAVVSGRSIADIQGAWGLGAGRETTPDPTVDRAAIRHRYAEAAARG